MKTKEETNWGKNLKVIDYEVADNPITGLSDAKITVWNNELSNEISKLISQEREKWNEDVYFNATNIAKMTQQTVGEKNNLYITLQQLEGMMSDL